MRQETRSRATCHNGLQKPFVVKAWILIGIAFGFSGLASVASAADAELSYPIVDSNQGLTYGNIQQMEPPVAGEAFYGQDAQYTGNEPSYTDNGDGTITDNVTGLMWAQDLSTSDHSWADAGLLRIHLVLP